MKEVRLSAGDEFTIAELKAKGRNKFRGWKCAIGLETLYIDFDGRIWRGPCHVGGTLGHADTGWEMPTEEVICTKLTCNCGTGIKVPKRLDDETWMVPLQEQLHQIQWDLGRRCNFDCSYCWPNSHNKTDDWISMSRMLAIIDRIEKDVPDTRLQFNFAGGEPTLHPDFLEVCREIHGRGHHIHVQTNGSRNAQYMANLAVVAEISISVHFEFMKPEKLIKNIKSILEVKGSKLEVKMMVAPNDESIDRMCDFERFLGCVPGIERARVIVSPLRDPVSNKLMPYTDNQKDMFGDIDLSR